VGNTCQKVLVEQVWQQIAGFAGVLGSESEVAFLR
jgi:hypothetical protein